MSTIVLKKKPDPIRPRREVNDRSQETILVREVFTNPNPVLVVSVYPEQIVQSGQNHRYVLKALPKDANGVPDWDNGYSSVWVHPGAHEVILATGVRQRQYKESAEFVATDYFKKWFDKGVFIAAGDEPTKAELKAAREKRDRWLRQQIGVGISEYNRRQQAIDVPSSAKLAAERFASRVPWVAEASLMTQCPYCKLDVRPGAIKCQHCHEFLQEKPKPEPDRERPAQVVLTVNKG